jgi:hypothetical protein
MAKVKEPRRGRMAAGATKSTETYTCGVVTLERKAKTCC